MNASARGEIYESLVFTTFSKPYAMHSGSVPTLNRLNRIGDSHSVCAGFMTFIANILSQPTSQPFGLSQQHGMVQNELAWLLARISSLFGRMYYFFKTASQYFLEMSQNVDKSDTIIGVFWRYFDSLLPIFFVAWDIASFIFGKDGVDVACAVGIVWRRFLSTCLGTITLTILSLDEKRTMLFDTYTATLAWLTNSKPTGTFGRTSIIPFAGMGSPCTTTVCVGSEWFSLSFFENDADYFDMFFFSHVAWLHAAQLAFSRRPFWLVLLRKLLLQPSLRLRSWPSDLVLKPS